MLSLSQPPTNSRQSVSLKIRATHQPTRRRRQLRNRRRSRRGPRLTQSIRRQSKPLIVSRSNNPSPAWSAAKKYRNEWSRWQKRADMRGGVRKRNGGQEGGRGRASRGGLTTTPDRTLRDGEAGTYYSQLQRNKGHTRGKNARGAQERAEDAIGIRDLERQTRSCLQIKFPTPKLLNNFIFLPTFSFPFPPLARAGGVPRARSRSETDPTPPADGPVFTRPRPDAPDAAVSALLSTTGARHRRPPLATF
jgi:hypothetical protein